MAHTAVPYAIRDEILRNLRAHASSFTAHQLRNLLRFLGSLST